MASAADGEAKSTGLEALHRLKSTEPPLYLTPSPELSKAARLASECLFASLSPYAPKCPLNQLWTKGFDAEQIWQQIDNQAHPLLASLRRQVGYFEKNPSEIEKQFNLDGFSRKEENLGEDGENKENYGVESESEDLDDDDEEEEEEEDEEGEEEEGDENEDEDEDEDDEEIENDEGGYVNGIEDKFLKIKELEDYLVEDEAREYGLKKEEKKNRRKRVKFADDEEEDENEEGDEDEENEDDEIGLMGLEDDDDGSDMENARYEDFFTSQKRTSLKKKSKYDDESDGMDMDEPEDDSNQNKQSLSVHENELGQLRAKVDEMEKANMQGKTKQSLSTHEKELEKLRAEIEEMERANLEPKTWTMQGEVTAAKRPINSALEIDMDFEQNAKPPPAPTVDDTLSLEELIMKRINEGQFDDVQRPSTLLTKAPKEKKELDENKSKKGLAELYEEEYAQKTGLVSTALSFSDEQKKEASMLFKTLCVKLDALSHFHFAPKPVIEDMSIQANVPALAIEEVAPLVVSDAAMLAPEEVFSGKGDIKEETELSKADRKRRRAKKKRQFKAESVKRMAVKAQLNTLKKPDNGNGES